MDSYILENSLDIVFFTPKMHHDDRGFFYEKFNKKTFSDITQSDAEFVQQNVSFSKKNTLRGLHFQSRYPQGKLISVHSGKVQDVVVDLRQASSTFGKFFSFTLSAEENKSVWIPKGYAHGFLVLSDTAEFNYLVDDFYYKEYEVTLLWSDIDLQIPWLEKNPNVSEKDRNGISFKDCEYF